MSLTLSEYYREHGESSHLDRVERMLTDEWQTVSEIAERAHRSRDFVRKALAYLEEEGRAEQGHAARRNRHRRWTSVTGWRR